MWSEALKNYASSAWTDAKRSLGPLWSELDETLDHCTADERPLMELALGTLPVSDVAGSEFDVLLAFARHAVTLRRESRFARDIPEDIFLHHVYYPRVNSEDLVDCRGFFAELLDPVVEGLSGEEAALAVNRWCAAQMTYEMTDTRSINPITAYYCGLGRCGEEATFGVTAFRALGIPARQVYVPWWSHCDDNHAWVEIFVDGKWRFLGACEPEPMLDRGWFNRAASRAMVVCSRQYFDFRGEGLKNEALVQQQGICLMYNQTARYAKTARTTVTVKDRQGRAAAGAQVRFYVLNMAAPARIAQLTAGENGAVSLETGLGTLLIEAEGDGFFAWAQTEAGAAVELVLDQDRPAPGIREYDFHAPAAGKGPAPLTEAQAAEKADTAKAANQLRTERIASYWSEEFQTGDEALDRVFQMAGGNARTLWDFYESCETKDWARTLLLGLAEKDWRDAVPAVLNAHLKAALALPGQERAEFAPYVLNPRMGFEWLEDWRSAVLAYFDRERLDAFRQDPAALWTWILEHTGDRDCRWHPVLWLRPTAALKLGAADLRGRRLLFVAVLRTLGVPARLSPIDSRAEYFDGAAFAAVEAEGPKEPMADLRLEGLDRLASGQDWTLSRWQQGWQVLDLSEVAGPVYRLPQGLYRLTVITRLPSGDQLAAERVFDLKEAGAAVELGRREPRLSQMFSQFPITLPQGLKKERQLLFWVEPATEPGRHVLNELLACPCLPLPATLLVPDAEAAADGLLARVREVLPAMQVETADFGSLELDNLARALYQEPGVWPLILLTDGEKGLFGRGGYAVGTVPLAVKLGEFLVNR